MSPSSRTPSAPPSEMPPRIESNSSWKALAGKQKAFLGTSLVLCTGFALALLAGLVAVVLAASESEQVKQQYGYYLVAIIFWTLLTLIFARLPWLAWREGWLAAAKGSPIRLGILTFFLGLALMSALIGPTTTPDGNLSIWIDQLRLWGPVIAAAVVFLLSRAAVINWTE